MAVSEIGELLGYQCKIKFLAFDYIFNRLQYLYILFVFAKIAMNSLNLKMVVSKNC